MRPYSEEMEKYLQRAKELEPRICVFLNDFNAKPVCDLLEENGYSVVNCTIKDFKRVLLVRCSFGFSLKDLLKGMAEVSSVENIERDITLCFGKEWL